MGLTKTPLLGLADFTPCRSYLISSLGHEHSTPGTSGYCCYCSPKQLTNSIQANACTQAWELAHQCPRKVSSPGIWHTAATKPVAGLTRVYNTHNAAETATNIAISAVGVNLRHIVVGQDIAPAKSISAVSRSYIVSAVFIVTFKRHKNNFPDFRVWD